jgi:hypothetical protein
VKDHPFDAAAAGDGGHVQCCDDQPGVVMGAHRVAEDPTRVQVDDRGQVELALVGADLGHITTPGDIRRRRGEHPLDQVRCGRALTLAGQAPPAALDPGGQAQLGHELRDRVVGDVPAGLAQLDADARAAVGAARVVEHLPDRDRQSSTPVIAVRWRPITPLVEP